MKVDQSLAVFEDFKIRRVYDEPSEPWCFSVADIVAVLLQQPDYQVARKSWKVLKGRLLKEVSQVVTNCYQLKLLAGDGKMRLKKEGSESVTNCNRLKLAAADSQKKQGVIHG